MNQHPDVKSLLHQNHTHRSTFTCHKPYKHMGQCRLPSLTLIDRLQSPREVPVLSSFIHITPQRSKGTGARCSPGICHLQPLE